MKQLLANIFRSRRPQVDVEEPEAVAPEAVRSEGPRLLLLVRDASSLGAYQVHSFDDEGAASEYVQFWFPPGFEHGALALWAGHEQGMELPGSTEKRAAEVVILIHDANDLAIVHPFSMPDMELATAWLREEQSNGLDLRHVSVLWAARAEIYRDARGRPRFRPLELPVYQPPVEERREEAPENAAPSGTRTRIVRKEGAHSEPLPAREETSEEEEGEPEPHAVSEALRTIVRGGRWEQKDEPFSSFDSPPGRF